MNSPHLIKLQIAAFAVILTVAAPHSLQAQARSQGRIYNSQADKCLQPLNGGTAPGTAIVLAACDDSPPQQWMRVVVNGSTLHYVNQRTGLCLDARGAAANHTPVQQWTCDAITNENWQYEQATNAPQPKVVSRVSGTTGFCLDVPGGGTDVGIAVQIYGCNGSPAQYWFAP